MKEGVFFPVSKCEESGLSFRLERPKRRHSHVLNVQCKGPELRQARCSTEAQIAHDRPLAKDTALPPRYRKSNSFFMV